VGIIIVLALRLTVPLTILRWPLLGGILAIVADTVDILIFQMFGFPDFVEYHQADKLLDSYYMALEVVVVQRWLPLPRTVATLLFAYRMVGVLVFELIDARAALLLFPNLFEMFFLFHLASARVAPAYRLTARDASAWLVVLLIPKMAQEYTLHYAKALDNLVALDIIQDGYRAAIGWLHDHIGALARVCALG